MIERAQGCAACDCRGTARYDQRDCFRADCCAPVSQP